MIITCENCSTSFNLDEKFLKPSGSKVRCSKCKHVFTAFPAAALEEKEAPPAEAPVEESEAMAGAEAAPDMDQETDAAVAEEGVQEEADVDADQPEDLDFDMGVFSEEAAAETVEPADDDELDLTGMGATLDMGAPPVEDAAVETEAATEDLDIDMDAEPEAAEEAEVEGLDLSALDEELDLETEPAGTDEVSEDLDLDLSALDEELDLETEPPADTEAGVEEVAEDLGLDLDMDAEPEAAQGAESEELDLSSLDEALDIVSEPVEEVAAETEDAADEDLLEDLDLDLDMDTEPEAAQEAESEELDLSSLDEALDMESEPVDEAAAATEDAVGDDLLEDLDLDFEMDTEPEADKEADDLDMSDIKFEFGDDEDAEAPAGDEDLELDLEMEPTVDESGKDDDDLDLAGFEETLEMDSPPDAEAVAEADDLDLELDLEMEADSKDNAESESADIPVKDVDEEIEDLDFELDMEFESDDDLEGAELELESDGTEDLDMSDIEQMLEVKDGGIPGGEVAGADLDAGPEVEKWKDTPGEKGLGEEPEELDLSDIDLDAEGVEDIEIEDQELDLDLDEETIKSAEAIAAGGKPIGEPEELDISQFEDLEVEEKAATGVISDGDIELEFEVEGDGADGLGGDVTSDVVEPTQQLDTIAMDAPPGMAPKAGEKTKEKKAKKEKKKKSKKTRPVGKSSPAKPLLAILLLLLIAFGAVVVLDKYVGIEIPYVTEYVRQVPYVNQLMNQDVKKSGEITTSNINSRFVDNEKGGRLFVITGKVKNEFPESRRFIQLTGRLFTSGKELVREEMIYCGNTLSDVQLTMMDLADMSNRLSNRFGDNRSNVDVKPGQQLPFMVVFSDFPQDLEEFTIEVLESSPVQQ